MQNRVLFTIPYHSPNHNISPDLSWRDIQYLIAYTSDTTKLRGEGWITNSAGLKVNSQFGFGVIDAEAFVTRAKYWTNVPEQKLSVVPNRDVNQFSKMCQNNY